MKTDLADIQATLRSALNVHSTVLKIRTNTDTHFEVAGTRQVMQGKQKVDGHYFASVIAKPKDIRLYFFPIYTHVAEYDISEELKKCLKGKSCFHIKKLTPELEREINDMIGKGVALYQSDNLI